MNLNRYTEKAQEALAAAQQIADRAGHPEIVPEHLLVALLDQRDGIVPAVLGKMNVPVASIAADVRALIDKLPAVQGGAQPGLSARLRRIANAAEDEAQRLKDEYTSTEHLLLAIASESGRGTVPAPTAAQKTGKLPGNAAFHKLELLAGAAIAWFVLPCPGPEQPPNHPLPATHSPLAFTPICPEHTAARCRPRCALALPTEEGPRCFDGGALPPATPGDLCRFAGGEPPCAWRPWRRGIVPRPPRGTRPCRRRTPTRPTPR